MQPQTREQTPQKKCSQNQKKKKQSKKQFNLSIEDIISIFRAAENNETGATIFSQLTQLNIKSLSYKHCQLLQDKTRQAIQLYYQIKNIQNQQKNSKDTENTEQLFLKVNRFIENFHLIIKCLKDNQFPAPVSDVFFNLFIQNTKPYLNSFQSNLGMKNKLLKLWQDIPSRNFASYLSQLQLKSVFNQIQSQLMQKILIGLLNDLKIAQCSLYYANYFPKLQKFQEQLFIPKLMNSDQLLTPSIIQLFKKKPNIKLAVLQNLDLAKALVVAEHLGEDPRDYPKLQNFIIRKHYLAMRKQYKYWYIFEDKMSFNPRFINIYCNEALQYKQGEIIKSKFPEDEKILKSMQFRSNLLSEHQIKKDQIIDNPLYIQDYFGITQNILKKLEEQTKTQIQIQYVQLSDYQIDQSMIIFIDKIGEQFDLMAQDVLNSGEVGFDAENRCTSTKYETQGVSLLQISTHKYIYIIDFLNLQSEQKFKEFFLQFLAKSTLIKIGHTINSDIKYLQKTFNINEISGFADISTIFKSKFPAEVQNSLAFIVQKLLGKKLSKFEQRSNWNRRPLKKTQIHYAALDAKICQQIFAILNQNNFETFKTATHTKKVKKEENQIMRIDRISYQKKYEYLLKQQKPKFLVDNMLKKLCSIMRNLGIDTQYVNVSNYQMMKAIGQKQQRIIITRDTKLLKKSKITIPIYCVQHKGDSEEMFEEVKNYFNINLELFKTLSRCVKCNSEQLQIITPEQAMKTLVFQYGNNKIEEFWRCQKCKQIYWEGNQFKTAKEKFESMK